MTDVHDVPAGGDLSDHALSRARGRRIPTAAEVSASKAAPTLFLSGLPAYTIGLRKMLKSALAPYDLRSCRLGVTCFNRPRTYAYVTVRSPEAAARLVREQHRRLRLDGTPTGHPPISIAPVTGKLDVLFQYLPSATRARLRLDDTALFSVTDQENAQRITQVILCMLAVAQRPPETKLANTLSVKKSSSTRAVMSAALAAECGDADQMQPAAESSRRPREDDMGVDEQEADGDAADEDTQSTRDMIYSPDAEIHRLVSEIASANWSTWTDLEEDPPADDGVAAAANTDSTPVVYQSEYSITDGCACAGGNAIDFGRHFARTTAIELDPTRCADLRTNLDVLRLTPRVTVVQEDANQALKHVKQDVVYVDPPWGGPQYKSLLSSSQDLYLGSSTLSDLCWQLYESNSCRMIVSRVPLEYDFDRLAATMVRIPELLIADAAAAGRTIDPFLVPRPHPFKVRLERVLLIILCLPSEEEKRVAREKILGITPATDDTSSPPAAASAFTAATPTPTPSQPAPLHFTLANLDSLIYSLNAYDTWHQCESEPAFFDWEKRRWIATRRWRGCTLRPATRVIDDDRQRALASEGRDKRPGQMSERDKKKLQEKRAKDKAKLAAKFARKQERKAAEAAAAAAAAGETTHGEEQTEATA